MENHFCIECNVYVEAAPGHQLKSKERAAQIIRDVIEVGAAAFPQVKISVVPFVTPKKDDNDNGQD